MEAKEIKNGWFELTVANFNLNNQTNNNRTFQFPTNLFINNDFIESNSKQTFLTFNPSNENPICSVAKGTNNDVELAVSAAKKASEFNSEWSLLTPAARGALLYKFADLIEQNREELATLESLDVGKPILESYNYDLKQVINAFRYFAGWTDKIHGSHIPFSKDYYCLTTHAPYGVVGLILPWNFPLQLLSWKLAPCLATGNTVIIKPATETPLTTLYLGKLIKEAGFPPGVVNIISGPGSAVGSTICSHPLIDKIGFTGSTEVGRQVQILAAKSNLKPCTLELGGKSPVIVFDDVADIDSAVVNSFHGLFWNAGQCCSAGSRIFVHENIYDTFITKMIALAEKRKIGNPLDYQTEQGPQVSKAQMDSILEYVEIGKKENARLVYGGHRVGNKGFYVAPTIFVDVTDNMTICKEEIFGPVMCILKFKDTEDVIRRANDSIFGLVGAVYTVNGSKAMAVANRVNTGLIWLNSYNIIEPSVPWGGVKQSGYGKDLSQYAIETFTVIKSVVIPSKL
eukprot:TRINITY_DN828_c2_g1_i1.p1 TRINITY_DN828_c2_g1~~TRINITY_DN828_c2_g1_i1.p1  ORF type:complete len:513 (-),score=211.37 TRINITY_DN828_c2_g1_i1:126-1664(-)